MSKDAIAGFFEKIGTETGLQTRVKEALEERGEMAPFEITEIAAEHGFEFTATELREHFAESPGELDDAALGAVAGGLLSGLRARFLRVRGRTSIRERIRKDALRARARTKKTLS